MGIINPDIAFDNYYDKTKYIIARNIALVTAFTFLILCYFFKTEGTEIILYYYIATVLSVFCLLFVLFSKDYKLVFYALSIGGTMLVQASANTGSHAVHYAGFSWTTLATILAFLGIGLRFGLFLLVTNVAGIVIFSMLFINENIAQLGEQLLTQKIGTAVEISVITGLTGYVMYHFVMFHKHSESLLKMSNVRLEHKNEQIMSQNEEKTILMKEIHHRVKNNLQLIVSLLRMQKEDDSSKGLDRFDESINRIMAMGLIHQKLYQQDDLSRVNINDYITSLVDEFQLVYKSEKQIEVSVQTSIDNVGLKMMIPLGLLMNELLTNSFKHAFNDVVNGSIYIDIKSGDNDTVKIKYNDSGTWSHPSSASFGLELIKTLVEQLSGVCERKDSAYSIIISNLKD